MAGPHQCLTPSHQLRVGVVSVARTRAQLRATQRRPQTACGTRGGQLPKPARFSQRFQDFGRVCVALVLGSPRIDTFMTTSTIQRLYTFAELCDLTQTPVSTMRNMLTAGTGPKALKLDGIFGSARRTWKPGSRRSGVEY